MRGVSIPTPVADELRVGVGRASLGVDLVFRASTVTSAFATSPLKLLTPRSRGTSVWAYTSSFGGGLVAGDQTRLDIRLGAGTRCFVGTQASSKIYRNPGRRPCGHTTQARLAPDSLLVFAPDPVQAFAQSIYVQRQEFELAPGAGLALVDWLTSGRAACGERWAFDQFQSRNEVSTSADSTLDATRVNPKCVFLDSLKLDSGPGNLAPFQHMGRFNCLAMLLLVGPPLREAAARLLAELSAQPVTRRASLIGSVSPVHDGALLRIAGEDVEAVGRELHRHLACLSDLLGDDPWASKW